MRVSLMSRVIVKGRVAVLEEGSVAASMWGFGPGEMRGGSIAREELYDTMPASA